MDLELISFDRCPFVQRSVITLLYKQVDFRVTYIDLADKPEWFLAISPLGKVPALRVTEDGNEVVLFESAVINEFIDEVTPGRLLPDDPVLRAQNRAWIEFSSTLFIDNYKMSIAATAEEFNAIRDEQTGHLQRIEAELGPGPFFNGDEFSLVDAAYAPFFMRTAIWEATIPFYSRECFPRVANWSEQLLAQPAVQESLAPAVRQRVLEHARNSAVYIGTLLAA